MHVDLHRLYLREQKSPRSNAFPLEEYDSRLTTRVRHRWDEAKLVQKEALRSHQWGLEGK